MKKIKLNPEKLQLKKEKIANLTQEQMNNVNGGLNVALAPSGGKCSDNLCNGGSRGLCIDKYIIA
jgi:hypothetical protein